jgi:hypothetical protein
MRRALLFMVLINAITFVPNGFAMEEEKENENVSIELSPDQPSQNENLPAEDNAPQRKRVGWNRLKQASTVIAIVFLLGAAFGPTAPVKIGLDGIINSVSPITVYFGTACFMLHVM